MANGKDQSQGFVDLFGNSTLTPAQIIQQQIARAVQGAGASRAGRPAPERLGGQLGAGIGSLFRQTLVKHGVLPKDPQVERAEKLQVVREEANKIADERGLNAAQDIDSYTDIFTAVAMRHNMEDVAFRAVQMRQVIEANRRAARLEEATITEKQAGATRDEAEAEKAAAETEGLAELNAARLEALQSKTTLNETRAEGLKVLTRLKEGDPDRKRGERFMSILDAFSTRLDKDPNARFTSGERKQLDEIARQTDPFKRLLSNVLPQGGLGAPPVPDGGQDIDLDLSATP